MLSFIGDLDRRENTILRGQLFEQSIGDPPISVCQIVYVIPNALVEDQFKPAPTLDISGTNTTPLPLPNALVEDLRFQ
jgi:hypothetical protein